MRKLFITNNTIDGISSLIVNRILHRNYTDVILSNNHFNRIDRFKQYNSITCVDIVPFSEEVFLNLLFYSKKIHIFTNNAPEWLLKYNYFKTIRINKNMSSSMIYYNALCYELPILENYLERINENKYKSIFARKCYMDYIDTIVHRIIKNI